MKFLEENNKFRGTCCQPKLKQQNINNFNIHAAIKMEAGVKILPTKKCPGLHGSPAAVSQASEEKLMHSPQMFPVSRKGRYYRVSTMIARA